MNRHPLCFCIAWNGLIQGRVHCFPKNQAHIIKLIFNETRDSGDCSGWITGKEAFHQALAESYISAWEKDRDEVIGRFKKLEFTEPNRIASAFHAIFKSGIFPVDIASKDLIERAVETASPYVYIASVFYAALTNPNLPRPPYKVQYKDLREIESKNDYSIIFGTSVKAQPSNHYNNSKESDAYLKSVWERIKAQGPDALSTRAENVLRDMTPGLAGAYKMAASVSFYTIESEPIILYRLSDNPHNWENYWPNVYFDLSPTDIRSLQESGILREGKTDHFYCFEKNGSPLLFDNSWGSAIVFSSKIAPEAATLSNGQNSLMPQFSFGKYTYTGVGLELLPFFQEPNQKELIRLGALLRRDYDYQFSVKVHTATMSRDDDGKHIDINVSDDLLDGIQPDFLTMNQLEDMMDARGFSHTSVILA